jgi:alpha-glucosidase
MRSLVFFLVTVPTLLPSILLAAQAPDQGAFFVPDQGISFSPLPNGIAIQDGGTREEIIALRDDVIRVRVGRGNIMPEDASWAVLPTARQSRVRVTPESSASTAGFRTNLVTIEVSKADLKLTIRNASGQIIQQDAQPIHFEGRGFRISKTMPLDEHYFGLGDKTGPLDRRDQSFSLWNTDAYRFQESTDPIYKAIPYFMTFRAGVALGVLLDNTWRTSFDFGKTVSDIYSFGAADGPLDYYILCGPSPRQVVAEYAWLTGTPPLPPMWSLGFQQSRYSYTPQSRVLEVADRLRNDRLPADAIYLDIGFQEKNRPFTVDHALFPDFSGMLAKLKQENFHVVAITDLHIAKLPSQNYAPYESGIAGDDFVKNPDGSVYSGKVWPGPSVFPDFTRQQTRAWWGTLYRDFHASGVEGFWNDMNEPSVFDSPTKTMPVDAVHRIDEPGFVTRTATHAEIHDVYGMENSRATFEGLKALDPNQRPFVLTRATYAGGQRYAATWTGDNSSSWNHLRMSTFMLKNLGLSGFAFTGADVGGYAGTPSTELLTKWLEIAAFQPIDRDHTELGTADQEPWVGGLSQEAIRRRFIETRYQLMPYLYTLAEESSRTGLPIERPLFLDYPNAAPDRHPLDLDISATGEFLLGHDLLIAPPPFPDELDAYEAEFPTTKWYDFWTGEALQSAQKTAANEGQTLPAAPLTASLHPVPETLPVFVRGGSILPMEPLVQSTNETPQGQLTLRVYAGEECSGSLYLDDGKTYAFQQGQFLRMHFTCEVHADSLSLSISPREGNYGAWWKNIRIEIYGWKAELARISVNGVRRETASRLPHGFSFDIGDDGGGQELVIQRGPQ